MNLVVNLELKYGVFEASTPEYFVYIILQHFLRRTTLGRMPSRRIRTYFPEIWKFRKMSFGTVVGLNIMEFDLK